MIKAVNFVQIVLGGDPEILLTSNDGKVVESEKVIGKKGLSSDGGKVVCDGIQAEFNLIPNTCREVLRSNFINCLNSVKGRNPKFESFIEIDEKDFASMSNESKVFGCKPSFDAYKRGSATLIPVNGQETTKRSCGGHIHLGTPHKINIKYIPTEITYKPECIVCDMPESCKMTAGPDNVTVIDHKKISIHDLTNPDIMSNDTKELLKKHYGIDLDKGKIEVTTTNVTKALSMPILTVPLLDLFCGIPSVLIDRDENAKLRRTIYGKAGDFRLPNYGLEYRSLSNFWMKSYQLFSLFYGLARHAVLYAATALDNPDMLDVIYNRVSKKEIAECINNNDFEKAKEIFIKLSDIFVNSSGGRTNNIPFANSRRIQAFKQFVINLEKYDQDVFHNWNNYSSDGWESFSDSMEIDHDIDNKFEEFTI